MPNDTTPDPLEIPRGVSPSLHPSIYSRYFELMKGNPIADQTATSVSVGLTYASHALATVYEAERAVVEEEAKLSGAGRRGTTFTGDLRMVDGKLRVQGHKYSDLAEAGEKALDVAIGKVDSERKRILNNVLELNRQLDKQLSSDRAARNPELCNQIRDRLATMTPAKAKAFLMERARAGDVDTIHAVYNAPPWLSGLKDEDFGQLRPTIYAALDKEGYERMQVADKMGDTLGLALKELNKRRLEMGRYRTEAQKKATDALSALKNAGRA